MTKRKQVEKLRAAEKSQRGDESILVASSRARQPIKRSWVRLDPDQSSKSRAAVLFALLAEDIAEPGI